MAKSRFNTTPINGFTKGKNNAPESKFPDIYNKDGSIVLREESEDKNGNIKVIESRIAEAIYVTLVEKNIETGDISLHLSSTYKGIPVNAIIKRGALTRKNLTEVLTDAGFEVHDHNISIIIKHLINEETLAPLKCVYNNLGFDFSEDKTIFKHHTAIGTDAKYVGNLNIEPKGELKVQHALIKKYILGRPALEFVSIAGLASSLLGFIGQEISQESIVVDISGESSKGKTTATMLAASHFGSPNILDNGLIRNFTTTQNAAISFLSGNNGLPMVIDELSMNNSKDLTSFVYQLAGGTEKARLNKDATAKEIRTWSNIIFLTGESPVLSRCNENTGLKVRVFQYHEVAWTPSAKVADIIKKYLLSNYGHTGLIFIKKLMKMGQEEAIAVWSKWKDKIYEKLIQEKKNVEFASRIAGKIALFLASGEIAKDALKLDFDLESVLEFMINNDKDADQPMAVDLRAYIHFCEVFNAFKSNFEYRHVTKEHPTKLNSVITNQRTNVNWGYIEYRDDSTGVPIEEAVVIIPKFFKELMIEGGFENVKGILKRWKERKILNHEEGRLTRTRNINTEHKIAVYCIRLIELEKSEDLVITHKGREKVGNKYPKTNITLAHLGENGIVVDQNNQPADLKSNKKRKK